MRDAVIVSAVRTASGKAPGGTLRFTRPDEMAATAIKEALARAPGLDPAEVEDVILGCGRPVLMVPYAGHFEQVGSTVLVAWNDSREATRALHDSLSLMATTSTLTVMTVIRNVGEEQDDESRGELVRHLARHGLTARSETSVAQEVDTAGVVLSRAADLTADLLVMGAYGHSRLRETILGGMTRDILEHMTVPVLMAH